MNILVRLPNWLGDVVMSAGFVRALHQRHPQARLHLISKAELTPLLPTLLPAGANFQVHAFAKKEWSGPLGPWRFGRHLRQKHGPFDRYYCLPNSFSTALLGWGSGAAIRIGYAADARGLLLTHALRPRLGQHRADDYTYLLSALLAEADACPPSHQAEVRLSSPATQKSSSENQALLQTAPLLLNFNSEAAARRMPIAKAVAIIQALQKVLPGQALGLLGAPREAERATAILAALPEETRGKVENLAGKTDLTGLVKLMQAAPLLLSTDSGPAHVANAVGTPLIVCFGPGDETNTGPYNTRRAVVARAPGPVPCGGCTNTCRFGDSPPCLLNLDETALAATVQQLLLKSGPNK